MAGDKFVLKQDTRNILSGRISSIGLSVYRAWRNARGCMCSEFEALSPFLCTMDIPSGARDQMPGIIHCGYKSLSAL